MMTTRTAAAAAAVLLLLGSPLQAGGMRTKFGQVRVRGLKIGQSYSLNKLIKLPLRVLNTGNRNEDIKISVIPLSGHPVAGYEPIPDISWVQLEKNEFTVEPNHEAVTDVIISVPNDPKLLGRRFEVHIWSRTSTKQGMYNTGIESQLLFEVSSVPPSEDELKKTFVDRQLANLDFTLYPTEGLAEDVPLGREFDLKKERKLAIKLVNPNDAALHFRIRPVPTWESMMILPEGFEDAPNHSWVRASTDTVVVEGNSIKETALLLKVPDEDRYRGKRYFFPIQVEVLEQEIPARVYYKLFVRTQPKQVPAGKEK